MSASHRPGVTTRASQQSDQQTAAGRDADELQQSAREHIGEMQATDPMAQRIWAVQVSTVQCVDACLDQTSLPLRIRLAAVWLAVQLWSAYTRSDTGGDPAAAVLGLHMPMRFCVCLRRWRLRMPS
jgi:hypothetical protein